MIDQFPRITLLFALTMPSACLAAGYPTDAEVMRATTNVRTDVHGHDKPDMVRTLVSCLKVSDGTAPGRRLGYLDHCVAYDLSMEAIGHVEEGGLPAATTAQIEARVHRYLAAAGVQAAAWPAIERSVMDRSEADLRLLAAVEAAPKRVYRRQDGSADVELARLADGSLHAHLDTGGHDCAGGVSGPLVGTGDTLVMSRTDENGGCALVISRTGGGLSVIEQACGDWHGAACDFNGNYPPAR